MQELCDADIQTNNNYKRTLGNPTSWSQSLDSSLRRRIRVLTLITFSIPNTCSGSI